jgi:hypothetical protein
MTQADVKRFVSVRDQYNLACSCFNIREQAFVESPNPAQAQRTPLNMATCDLRKCELDVCESFIALIPEASWDEFWQHISPDIPGVLKLYDLYKSNLEVRLYLLSAIANFDPFAGTA